MWDSHRTLQTFNTQQRIEGSDSKELTTNFKTESVASNFRFTVMIGTRVRFTQWDQSFHETHCNNATHWWTFSEDDTTDFKAELVAAVWAKELNKMLENLSKVSEVG